MDYRLQEFPGGLRRRARRRVRVGVIPLENVLQGSVGQCFDLFMEYDVYIQTESVARIQHTLLSVESSPEAIKVVYSHPQRSPSASAGCVSICPMRLLWPAIPPPPPRAGRFPSRGAPPSAQEPVLDARFAHPCLQS